MEIGIKAVSLRILESVPQKSDSIRSERLHLSDYNHRSEQTALLRKEELTCHLSEIRNTSEYFHDVHERNLKKKIIELVLKEIE